MEASKIVIPTIIYVPIRGALTNARHNIFSVVPGFRGLTSWGEGTFAVFNTKPAVQALARLHQLAGGPP